MSTYLVPIYSQTISTAVNAITFNNIPQTYQDLFLLFSVRATGSNNSQGIYIQFNGDGSNNYSSTYGRSTGNAIDSFRGSNSNAILSIEVPNDQCTSGIFSNIQISIPSYRSSRHKQIITDVAKETNAASGIVFMQNQASLWRNTSAISSMTIGTNITAPNFVGGSTFSLYGIKNS